MCPSTYIDIATNDETTGEGVHTLVSNTGGATKNYSTRTDSTARARFVSTDIATNGESRQYFSMIHTNGQAYIGNALYFLDKAPIVR